MNKWVLDFNKEKHKQLSEERKRKTHEEFAKDRDYRPYPYIEVRGIINMQSESIRQSEQEKDVKIL